MKTLLSCLCCTAMLTLMGGAAMATTFMSDSFDYADGDLTVYDGTGDDVSGGKWTPHSGTGFSPSIKVVGGQAVLLNSGSEDANRLASGQVMGLGDTWYYAAVVTVNDQRADPSTESINNDYFIHFKDSSFNFRGRTVLTDPAVADPNKFRFAIASTSLSSGQTEWGTDLNFGQQYKIVVSWDFDSASANLWVDPVDENSISVNHTVAGANFIQVESLGLRQDFISPSPGTPNNQILIDGVAIGDDFATVFENSMNGSNIPEPSSMVLALAGLVGLVTVRRSNRG